MFEKIEAVPWKVWIFGEQKSRYSTYYSILPIIVKYSLLDKQYQQDFILGLGNNK